MASAQRASASPSRGTGSRPIVDPIIAAVPITVVQQRLQPQDNILVGGPQRHGDVGQRLPQRHWVQFRLARPGRPANANHVGRAADGRQTVFRDRQHKVACSNQVDFHQVDFGVQVLALFANVDQLTGGSDFVGGTQDFDRGNQPPAAAGIHDFQVPEGCRFILQLDDVGFGYIHRRDGRRCRALGSGHAGVFDDANVRVHGTLGLAVFHDCQGFFHASLQVVRQLRVELVRRVDHESRMDVAPVRFQVRIHSRKWTSHDESSHA